VFNPPSERHAILTIYGLPIFGVRSDIVADREHLEDHLPHLRRIRRLVLGEGSLRHAAKPGSSGSGGPGAPLARPDERA